MLLIKNTHMIDPASGTDARKDILIQDDKIIKIADSVTEKEAAVFSGGEADMLQVIDAGGMIAAPGLVDAHVHFREPGFEHKEDIRTGARAAAAGGVTTVVLMANTNPCVDNPETLARVLEKGKQTAIHVTTCANVTRGMKGQELTDMPALLAAGAVGFTDDGIPLLEEETARRAMEQAAALGVPISFHEENPAFIENNGINRGKASAFYGIGGSDRQAEIDLVARDVRLAEETGACVVIQHISTKEAVQLVREAKKRGADVHAEATPHHFTLTEEAAIKYGTMAKMNPPLREEADRLAIIEGLKDNTIDMIATDHAPHSAEEKARELTAAPSGIIGLETSLPLAVTRLVKAGHIDYLTLFEKMCLNPAKLYRMKEAGRIREGGAADLVLFDDQTPYTVEKFHSKASNSPFVGAKLYGKVHYTICSGETVYRAE